MSLAVSVILYSMPDSGDQERLGRVARYVRQARLAVGMTIDEAAESVRMSPVTWIRVESGKTVRPLTYSAIERALNWKAGSIDLLVREGTAPGFEERSTPEAANPIEELVRQVWASEKMPEDRKADLVRIIRRAEADVRAAQDEIRRWDADSA